MTRYLDRLSWTAIAALDKTVGVVVLPIGATEQHGPHLPIMTDTRQVEAVLAEAFKILPAEVAAWALPALPYSKSNEHVGFAGTMALSGATLTAILTDLAKSVARAEFRRLAFLNGHGGNVGLLDTAARDIRAATGLLCFCVQPNYWLQPTFDMTAQEQCFGIHAGELETSLMARLEPSLVDLQQAVKHYPDLPEGEVRLYGPAAAAWLTEDWSPTGVFGDATAGTPEKGDHLLGHAAERLARLLTEMSTFEVACES